MNEVEKLVNDIMTHNIQIAFMVNQIEQKFPGKTLAELMIESALT
jgi:hypothetical protein